MAHPKALDSGFQPGRHRRRLPFIVREKLPSSPLSPWPLFAIHPSVGFTFGLALALVLVLFPAALFRAHQSATNTRDGSALPSAIPASAPRRYVMARLACLERERVSHT